MLLLNKIKHKREGPYYSENAVNMAKTWDVPGKFEEERDIKKKSV
jgi:hypothetical protein